MKQTIWLLLVWVSILFLSCASKKGTLENSQDVKNQSTSLSWQQTFLDLSYIQNMSYESYPDAKDFTDETNRRILWEGVEYGLLGATSELSEVFMTSIEIYAKDKNKIYNFPRDVILKENVVHGRSLELRSVDIREIGAGYSIQTLPDGRSADFTGDNESDIFFGLLQSGTTDITEYYLLTYNSKANVFECVGYNIGYKWVDDQYIEDRIPIGYGYNPQRYFIYPQKSSETDNYHFFQQVYPLFTKEKNKEDYKITDGVKGVFILTWAYGDSQWVVINRKVNLQGRLK